MRDDILVRRVSATIDGEDDLDLDALPAHAAQFREDALRLRALVRIELADTQSDLADVVLARVGSHAARRWTRVGGALAAFVVAAMVGFVVGGGLNGTTPTVAAHVAARVLAAQHLVQEIDVAVSITERGWHPDIPARTYAGILRYREPETLRLDLYDTTTYPSTAWHRNDVTVVVDATFAWSRGYQGCPVELTPCADDAERTSVLTQRAPFSDRFPAPLDLVVPTGGFLPLDHLATNTTAIDVRGDRVVVTDTAGRFTELLSALFGIGTWRPVHPSDMVTIELDRDTLTLRRLYVTAGDGEARALWGLRTGHDDPPATVILDARLVPIVAEAFPTTAPDVGVARVEGFVDDPAAVDPTRLPSQLPDGFAPYRFGRFSSDPNATLLASWSDGRAWLVVRMTEEWDEPRLFGEADDVVRTVDLGAAGVGYLDPTGRRLAVHTADADYEFFGTVSSDALIHTASSLPDLGLPIPAGWLQSPAEVDLPTGTLRPVDPFIARVDDARVTIHVAGPGTLSYTLVQQPASTLPLPSDPDASMFTVRSSTGRFSPNLGRLEWLEAGSLCILQSTTMSGEQLVTEAGRLRP